MSGKSNIKPMGLRKKPTFNEVIDYITSGQEVIKYPNRYFRQLRDSPWLTQIDGEDSINIEVQQLNQAKIVQRDTIIREVAKDTGTGAAEGRVHNHITHNHTNNTYVGGPSAPPPPPPSTSSGSQTDHPLKQSTGTGSDYAPPPDAFTPTPPPPQTATVHQSTSRTRGVNSVINQTVLIGGASSSNSGQTNPILEKHNNNKRPGAQVFDMAVDDEVEDKAMDLQQQSAVNKEYQATAQREQRERSRGAVKANLAQVNVGHQTAKNAADAARNSVMSAHLDRAVQNAQARHQQQNESLQSREQAQSAAEAHTQAVRARVEAEHASAKESLEQKKKEHAQASAARDADIRTKEVELEREKKAHNLSALNLEVAHRHAIRIHGAGPAPTAEAPAEAPRRGRSSSAATVQYGEDATQTKARGRTRTPAPKIKLDSAVIATKALDTGIKRATSVVNTSIAKKMKTQDALDTGIKGANKIIIGNTIKNVKAKQALKKGISKATSMVKAKASVEPQPDSATTVIKKRAKPKSIVLPVKKGRARGNGMIKAM